MTARRRRVALLAWLSLAWTAATPAVAQVTSPPVARTPRLARIAVSSIGGCGVSAEGGLYCWGAYHPSRRTDDMADGVARVSVAEPVEEVALTPPYGWARTRSGRLWTLRPPRPPEAVALPGGGTVRELHDGTARLADGRILKLGFRVEPTDLGAGNRRAAAGERAICAITSAGELRCEGTELPPPLRGRSDVIDVTAEHRDVCALRRGGSVVCWFARGDDEWIEVRAPRGASGLEVGAARACVRTRSDVMCAPLRYERGHRSRFEPTGLGAAHDLSALHGVRCAAREDGVACRGIIWRSEPLRASPPELREPSPERRLPRGYPELPAGARSVVRHSSSTTFQWCALVADRVRCARGDDDVITLDLEDVVRLAIPGDPPGDAAACAVQRSGATYCWGTGDIDRLGFGSPARPYLLVRFDGR